MWFTLDALRLEPDIWSSASYEDVVLHELGHVWDDWLGGQQWPLIQAEFYEHYAGCRSRGRSNEQLRVEIPTLKNRCNFNDLRLTHRLRRGL